MKIGQKIAFFYTAATLCIIALFVVFCYLIATRYIDRLYGTYLSEKALLAAQFHWERDEVDELSYEKISLKYGQTLPQATELLFDADSAVTQQQLNQYLAGSQIDRLYTGRAVSFSYENQQGTAVYYPDNEGNFIVLVMAHNFYGNEIQNSLLIVMIVLLCVSAILVFFIGRICAGRILEPLQLILKEIRHIRGNNLEIRLKKEGNQDELDELAQTVNDMLDRIDTNFNSEKSFIRNASHELNNPLTAIQGECEISLMKERTPVEYIEALQRISTETKRVTLLIKNLLFLSRDDNELLRSANEPVPLIGFLTRLCRSQNDTLGSSRIRFSPDTAALAGAYLTLDANPSLLRIALQNIVENACKYSGDKPVDVRLSGNETHTTIEIEDYGIGIPEGEIEQIFQSFFRGSNVRGYTGHGIGLGLSLKILNGYGATVDIRSQQGQFTRVIITFEVGLPEGETVKSGQK